MASTSPSEGAKDLETFPWDIGACDAHCHPTDTMASLGTLGEMRASVLTIMATRSQDQDLVAEVAQKYGLRDEMAFQEAIAGKTRRIADSKRTVPAFGWHPWFSHHIFDDKDEKMGSDSSELKIRHYGRVLTPSPVNDAEFMESLPQPWPLSGYLAKTRKYLEDNPLALVGEIGLDKAFRIPFGAFQSPVELEDSKTEELTPGGREGRRLSPYKVTAEHQITILKAQLALAGEMGRAVSVHGVQVHGILHDALASCWKGHEKPVQSRRDRKRLATGVNEDFSSSNEEDDDNATGSRLPRRKKVKSRPYPPRICLHSFSGSMQVLRQYTQDKSIPTKIFFSFSTCINFSTTGGSAKTPETIAACPDDRILVESDLHTAGERMDGLLEDIYRKVCEIKGWPLREGVERIRRNYEAFILG